MITIACCLWDANEHSLSFSREYTEADVEKFTRAWRRHLPTPHRVVCFTDKPRAFNEPIWQERLSAREPDYGSMIEPFKLNEPSIICGLDTLIVGDCSELAQYCLDGAVPAVPRDPFQPQTTCNGVVLVPKGHGWVWEEFTGGNDMDYTRAQPWAVIDSIFPKQVVSYKGHVQHYGLEPENRIVMLHGRPKAAELTHLDWVADAWR